MKKLLNSMSRILSRIFLLLNLFRNLLRNLSRNSICILFCTLLSQGIYADVNVKLKVNCPDPQNLKSLQFTAINREGYEQTSFWQLLSSKFNDNGNQWNLMFAVTSSLNALQTQVIQDAVNFFKQQNFVLQSQTQKDIHTICRYSAKNTNTRIIVVHPPMIFTFSNKNRMLTGPYFPDVNLEDSWPVSPTVNNKTKNPVKNIQGIWMHDQAQTSIKQKNGEYKFCNEFKNCASGTYLNGNISVPAWNVQGQVIQFEKSQAINWSNGTIWKR